MYLTLKLIHIIAVIATITGFTLRGFWMLTTSPNLQRRIVRIAPHVVDTLLLASGIGLILTLNIRVFEAPWLLAKLITLGLYIVLGTIALKRGKSRRLRLTALLLALAVFAYILGVALSKSVWSWIFL